MGFQGIPFEKLLFFRRFATDLNDFVSKAVFPNNVKRLL